MTIGCYRTIYMKLASAFTEEQAVLYHQRVEEISPNIRYCAYNIGETHTLFPHCFYTVIRQTPPLHLVVKRAYAHFNNLGDFTHCCICASAQTAFITELSDGHLHISVSVMPVVIMTCCIVTVIVNLPAEPKIQEV